MGRIYGHRLRFHKRSEDGSGKCDIESTNDAANVVYGVVFEIPAREKSTLDLTEGLGNGYLDKEVAVRVSGGRELRVITYYATNIDPSLRPYHWYKEHVLRGAREHGLPSQYIAVLEAVRSIADPDKRRHVAELSVYGS